MKATNGDTYLGGEDFDLRIVDAIAESFENEHEVDLRKDRMALQRLKEAAEKAKHELSSSLETEINLPFIATNPKGEPLHVQKTMTRTRARAPHAASSSSAPSSRAARASRTRSSRRRTSRRSSSSAA